MISNFNGVLMRNRSLSKNNLQRKFSCSIWCGSLVNCHKLEVVEPGNKFCTINCSIRINDCFIRVFIFRGALPHIFAVHVFAKVISYKISNDEHTYSGNRALIAINYSTRSS